MNQMQTEGILAQAIPTPIIGPFHSEGRWFLYEIDGYKTKSMHKCNKMREFSAGIFC
jgi:hypothetical protein